MPEDLSPEGLCFIPAGKITLIRQMTMKNGVGFLIRSESHVSRRPGPRLAADPAIWFEAFSQRQPCLRGKDRSWIG
jgi:hypothetical protein